MAQLLTIMRRLRDPLTGCPWDLKQDFASLRDYTLEEAYEVAEAVDRQDYENLRDELGDLLFQVVFYAQLAQEQGRFDFQQVAQAICEKLERRHPHIFNNLAQPMSAEQVRHSWERIKADERTEKQRKKSQDPSVLADIPNALPAMIRAEKIQQRVSRVKFDWETIEGVIEKLEEEIREVREVLKQNALSTDTYHEQDVLKEELGDLLFSCINLVRFAGYKSEIILRQANDKFIRRFNKVERVLQKENIPIENAGSELLNQLWQLAKQENI